jgi:hypothetical protein
MEALRMRIYMPFKTGVAYPNALNVDAMSKEGMRKTTPPPSAKVS